MQAFPPYRQYVSKSENQEINPLSPTSRAAVPPEGVRGQHRRRGPAPAPRSRRCGIGGFSILCTLILFLPLLVVVSEGEEDSHVCFQSFLWGGPDSHGGAREGFDLWTNFLRGLWIAVESALLLDTLEVGVLGQRGAAQIPVTDPAGPRGWGARGRSRQPLATLVSPLRPPLCGGPPLLGSPSSPPLRPLPVPSLLCPGLLRRPARLCKAISSSREPSHRLLPTAVLSPWPGPLQLAYWLALRLCEVECPSYPSPAQRPAQCRPRVAVLWVEGHRL